MHCFWTVPQDIPRLIFQILAQLATLNASVSPAAWPSRISFPELQGYAQRRQLDSMGQLRKNESIWLGSLWLGLTESLKVLV